MPMDEDAGALARGGRAGEAARVRRGDDGARACEHCARGSAVPSRPATGLGGAVAQSSIAARNGIVPRRARLVASAPRAMTPAVRVGTGAIVHHAAVSRLGDRRALRKRRRSQGERGGDGCGSNDSGDRHFRFLTGVGSNEAPAMLRPRIHCTARASSTSELEGTLHSRIRRHSSVVGAASPLPRANPALPPEPSRSHRDAIDHGRSPPTHERESARASRPALALRAQVCRRRA